MGTGSGRALGEGGTAPVTAAGRGGDCCDLGVPGGDQGIGVQGRMLRLPPKPHGCPAEPGHAAQGEHGEADGGEGPAGGRREPGEGAEQAAAAAAPRRQGGDGRAGQEGGGGQPQEARAGEGIAPEQPQKGAARAVGSLCPMPPMLTPHRPRRRWTWRAWKPPTRACSRT